MPFRLLAIAALLLLAAPALAAPFWAPAPAAPAKRPPIAAPAKRPSPADAPAPPVMFYVAKGAPDACGRGCDRWIAVEGQINGDAAGRFKAIHQAASERPAPADVFFLARRQSRTGDFYRQHAARIVRHGKGGANDREGVRFRSADLRCLPEAEAIRPRACRRPHDPQRAVQFRVSLSHAGRGHRAK